MIENPQRGYVYSRPTVPTMSSPGPWFQPSIYDTHGDVAVSAANGLGSLGMAINIRDALRRNAPLLGIAVGGLVFAGIALFVVWRKKTKATRKRNARKRGSRRSNSGALYELVYSTGGHGGPYPSVAAAMEDAELRIRGNRNERWIAIVRNRDVPNLWDALAVSVLRKRDEDSPVMREGPLEMRHLIGTRRR
jgi:hypothetical protein